MAGRMAAEGHAKWAKSEFENGGEKGEMREIPPLDYLSGRSCGGSRMIL